jgi:cytochrome c peroxidase
VKRIVLAALLTFGAGVAQSADFTDAELRAVLLHGPWPAPWSPDPSNRASGNPEAIELGERLFFDPRLSPSGKVLCATCHAPFRGFQDARARAFGLAEVDRNTPSIFNARYNRWFGWDGAHDSLWAQSIRPILEPREMGGSQAQTAALVRGDAELSCRYEKVFGAPPPADDETVLAGIGKALAAFQETIVTGRTPFDDFRDALEKGDHVSAALYPAAALRGLRIFVGKGNCSACHAGPGFSNGEFLDAGVPVLVAGGGVDPGREGGIRRLQANPFNLLGRHNDDRTGKSALKTRRVSLDRRNSSGFRVPGLRNAALTAPYMHNGSVASLADVARSHPDPGRPYLSAQESADLVAFLESLTESPGASVAPPKLPLASCRR